MKNEKRLKTFITIKYDTIKKNHGVYIITNLENDRVYRKLKVEKSNILRLQIFDFLELKVKESSYQV